MKHINEKQKCTCNVDVIPEKRTHEPCVPTSVNRITSGGMAQRKSPRADFHNYSGGQYFVTICTADKKHYFGEIYHGEMHLNDVGKAMDNELANISKHYKYAEVPLWVVMPNHIHAIINISSNKPSYEQVDGAEERTHEPCVPTKRTGLSVIVGGLKRTVTLYARRNNIEFAWQSRYHDHIIRGTHDGNRIADYIQNNVARWANDCFY